MYRHMTAMGLRAHIERVHTMSKSVAKSVPNVSLKSAPIAAAVTKAIAAKVKANDKAKAQSGKAAAAAAASALLVYRGAYGEGVSRAALVATLKAIKTPSEYRTAYDMGRVAARFYPNETEEVARAKASEFMRAKDANGTRELKDGETRRTPEQQAFYVALKTDWKRLLEASGHKAKPAAKAKGAHTGGTKDETGLTPDGAKVDAPAATVTTREEAFAALQSPVTMIGHMLKKHAKLFPAGFAEDMAKHLAAMAGTIAGYSAKPAA